ncbi:SprT-like domain-containing protein [Candidatus Woesearchaeota archaeon]|nr:SprT-like domain-containing protein [Candidatus Woesearchaeota archaeon]
MGKMSSLIIEAFQQLYPEKELKYSVSLKYSRKFKPYNANVKLYGNSLTFNLSKEWKKISKEIQIGLVQELLVKILKDKKKTMNMELYSAFLKNIHIAVPKTKTDKILEASFNRVNEAYFNGMLDKPNLEWGNSSTSKLGSYEYGSDTITISTIFKNEKQELLDYVMHHEMLHKKFKFQNQNGRNLHHSSEFKKMEIKFENRGLIEKEISGLARKHRLGLRAILSF